MSIPLHPEKGINPMMAICPRCGEHNGEIVLMGRGRIYTCRCGRKQAGYRFETCPDCGETRSYTSRPVEEHDRIAGGLCDECVTEIKEHEAIVAAGGVFFRCKCGASGVIKAEAEICAEVRRIAGVEAPAPCGLDVDECDICKGKGEVSEEGNADQG